jgi:hypothetical protein
MSQIPFFNSPIKDECDRFLVSVALGLEARAFAPLEWIYRVNEISTGMCELF